MQYYVDSVSKKVSSRGSEYVEVTLNKGEEVLRAFCWNIQAGSLIKPKSFIQASVEEKNGFYNIDPVTIRVLDISEVNSQQFANLMLTSPVTYEYFLEQFTALHTKLEMPAPFRNFFDKFNWESFFKSYIDVPAAISMHHDIPNGLFLHMSEMLEIYSKIAETKWAKTLAHEYIILGIVFHDLGKITNYDIPEYKYNYTTPLLGHIYISAHSLQNILVNYNTKDWSEELKLTAKQIHVAVHCVLAHHRNKEWGSPVTPATKEAMVLHFIDELSGKGNMFDKATDMESSKPLQTTIIKV